MNESLFRWIFGLSHRVLFLDSVMAALANQLPYLLALGALYLIFRASAGRRRVFFFVETLLALILSRGIVVETIRFFYVHPRPFETLKIEPLFLNAGSSFPSGHAAFFFALAATLWFYNCKWGAWFFVLALVNGFARVYAGVHWPFDIAGGAIVGIASVYIVHSLLAKYREMLTGEVAENLNE